MPRAILPLFAALVVCSSACGESSAPSDSGPGPTDVGSNRDSGAADATPPDAMTAADSGVHPDGGTIADAGADAGAKPDAAANEDSGPGLDAETPMDAGVDAGPNADGGSSVDAGSNADAGADAGVPDTGVFVRMPLVGNPRLTPAVTGLRLATTSSRALVAGIDQNLLVTGVVATIDTSTTTSFDVATSPFDWQGTQAIAVFGRGAAFGLAYSVFQIPFSTPQCNVFLRTIASDASVGSETQVTIDYAGATGSTSRTGPDLLGVHSTAGAGEDWLYWFQPEGALSHGAVPFPQIVRRDVDAARVQDPFVSASTQDAAHTQLLDAAHNGHHGVLVYQFGGGSQAAQVRVEDDTHTDLGTATLFLYGPAWIALGPETVSGDEDFVAVRTEMGTHTGASIQVNKQNSDGTFYMYNTDDLASVDPSTPYVVADDVDLQGNVSVVYEGPDEFRVAWVTGGELWGASFGRATGNQRAAHVVYSPIGTSVSLIDAKRAGDRIVYLLEVDGVLELLIELL